MGGCLQHGWVLATWVGACYMGGCLLHGWVLATWVGAYDYLGRMYGSPCNYL